MGWASSVSIDPEISGGRNGTALISIAAAAAGVVPVVAIILGTARVGIIAGRSVAILLAALDLESAFIGRHAALIANK